MGLSNADMHRYQDIENLRDPDRSWNAVDGFACTDFAIKHFSGLLGGIPMVDKGSIPHPSNNAGVIAPNRNFLMFSAISPNSAMLILLRDS